MLVKNPVEKSFYVKRKKKNVEESFYVKRKKTINILTAFFISYKIDVKTFLK